MKGQILQQEILLVQQQEKTKRQFVFINDQFIIVIYMNQRSTSILRKLKTDLGEEHTFQRKIAKAMKNKKQIISKMTTPRSSQPIRNYNSYNPHSSKGFKSIQSNNNSKQQSSIIHINRNFVQNMQQTGCFGNFSCINHPKKKGVFQDIHQRDFFYCHQCAINLVKSNVAMMEISSQSLIIKMFLEEQLSKLTQEQHKAKNIIQQYYASLRQTFSNLYKESHLSLNKHQIVEFANFQISDSINKIVQDLGKMEICQLKFDSEPEKQNLANNRQSIDKNLYKFSKERFVDHRIQPNHSLESNSKNSSFINRSRDNSFYKKSAKPDIPKNSKYDSKKGFYLR